MKVAILETTGDGQQLVGTFTLESNDIIVEGSEDNLDWLEAMLDNDIEGVSAVDDPEVWLELLPTIYKGAMLRAVLADDEGEETTDASSRSEAVKKAWLKRERAKPKEESERGESATEEKSQRAKASYNPMNAMSSAKLKIAKAQEDIVAKIIGGTQTPNNQPFDVLTKGHGCEVKTIIGGKNDKITMHPAALERKIKEARKLRVKPHTIAIDARGGEPVYYYRAGVGSFRLASMMQVSLSELKKLVR